MLLVPIFALPSKNQGVYACVWPPDRQMVQNALNRFFALWTNQKHIRKTLRSMKRELESWSQYRSDPDEAVMQVQEEANYLYKQLTNTAKLPGDDFVEALQDLFTDLTAGKENREKKARAVEVAIRYPSPSLLRLYALEYGPGLYLVTGGCFKAVLKSSQDPSNSVNTEIARIRELNTLLDAKALPLSAFKGSTLNLN